LSLLSGGKLLSLLSLFFGRYRFPGTNKDNKENLTTMTS
jgi:hypothetical protein